MLGHTSISAAPIATSFFNPNVTVEYQVAQKENISIWVVDLNGKKIKTFLSSICFVQKYGVI